MPFQDQKCVMQFGRQASAAGSLQFALDSSVYRTKEPVMLAEIVQISGVFFVGAVFMTACVAGGAYLLNFFASRLRITDAVSPSIASFRHSLALVLPLLAQRY